MVKQKQQNDHQSQNHRRGIPLEISRLRREPKEEPPHLRDPRDQIDHPVDDVIEYRQQLPELPQRLDDRNLIQLINPIFVVENIDERRQILSGIAEWYTPEELIGRRIVVITNLAPRKMRGLESHGMLLAASHGENGKPVLATFGEDIALGSRLK